MRSNLPGDSIQASNINPAPVRPGDQSISIWYDPEIVQFRYNRRTDTSNVSNIDGTGQKKTRPLSRPGTVSLGLRIVLVHINIAPIGIKSLSGIEC